jgi:dihydrolipoamide dehydrogenase
MADYDLIIIGTGPGGYVAAVRAAQLGLKTVCIEKQERLGGVCLNVGCIPSKALLDSSEYYHLARTHLQDHGVITGKVGLDLAAMMARKETVVADLTHNVRRLLEHHKIDILRGSAQIAAPGKVTIERSGQEAQTLQAPHILLATGSVPVEVPAMAFDDHYIVNSTGALQFESVPQHLGIVGGGYIGLELGSVWLRLGAKVTVIEMLPKIGTSLDGQVARTLDRILRKQGFDFRLNTQVTDAKVNQGSVEVAVTGKSGDEVFTFDRLLVSVGRRPLTQGLGLEAVGVRTDAKTGHVVVDPTYQTNVPGIYAIGDLVPGPMLAHKASAEGIAAVESMAGQFGEVNYDTLPSVIYTAPEVAAVGLTEDQIKARQIPYCKGTYPFTGAGRARCMGQTDGFVKLLAHAKTDRILGVHIIGPRAADMIAEAVLAMEFGASSEDVARTVHGHPSFGEALQEAAMQVRQCSIYAS